MSTPDLLSPELAEQRREIVALARDFVGREITPHSAEWDRQRGFPADVLHQLDELRGLQEQGLVALARNRIEIADLDGLRSRAR